MTENLHRHESTRATWNVNQKIFQAKHISIYFLGCSSIEKICPTDLIISSPFFLKKNIVSIIIPFKSRPKLFLSMEDGKGFNNLQILSNSSIYSMFFFKNFPRLRILDLGKCLPWTESCFSWGMKSEESDIFLNAVWRIQEFYGLNP